MPHPALRFAIGDRVKCRLPPRHPDGAWSGGTVTALWYTEPTWDCAVPYQVRLDSNLLVWAPEDCSIFIVAFGEDPPCCAHAWLFENGPTPVRLLSHLRSCYANNQQPERDFWFWLCRLVEIARCVGMVGESTQLPETWAGPISWRRPPGRSVRRRRAAAGPEGSPFWLVPDESRDGSQPDSDESDDDWVTHRTSAPPQESQPASSSQHRGGTLDLEAERGFRPPVLTSYDLIHWQEEEDAPPQIQAAPAL